MGFEKTWRWFGRNDTITLSQIKQIGIDGIVTALHHIPNGEIWTVDEIKTVQKDIEKHGMCWSVVESLPVHECLKYGGVERDGYIENYKQSLENLGECGIKTICYNFMPVIDWIRTKLDYKLPNGIEVLYFNLVDLVVFDLCILKRTVAEFEYPEEIITEARLRFYKMTEEDISELIDTIIVKTQGFVDGINADNSSHAVSVFKNLLENYSGIEENQLRENLKYFLNAIIPTAEKQGIKMCIHPDDPPIKVLGLPRIVSSREDIKWIFDTIPSTSNALTFCTGSLGVEEHNDLNKMVKEFSSRIYFAHLRSTQRIANGNFYEAEHLEGSVDMYEIVRSLLIEMKRRETGNKMPMRVDHGRKLLFDFDANYKPGYPLLGRMKAMTEISGMIMGVERSLIK